MQLFFILLLSLLLNIIIGYHASYKRNVKEGENVYDIGFDALPNLEKYHKIGDYILIIPILFVLFSWNLWSRSKKGNYLSMLILMYHISLYYISNPFPFPTLTPTPNPDY